MHEELSQPKDRKWSLISLVICCFASAIFGALDFFLYEHDAWLSASDWIYTIVFVGTVAAWCHCDAQYRGYRISKVMRIGIILLMCVAVPIYLIASRGWLKKVTNADVSIISPTDFAVPSPFG